MCGYIGTVSNHDIDISKIKEVNKLIECRGPDETVLLDSQIDNTINSKNINFAFIFNRLAILDLSDLASQPMYSERFNTAVLFNGEIFNHNELRNELELKGVQFLSNNSDTEVVLLGISYFGKEFIKKLIGQFAISFIDFNTNEILLIRDRLAQKPLFYHYDKEGLTFSSNLKSIQKLKLSSIDEESLNQYLLFGVVPTPKTIFKDIYKLNPGEIIKYSFEKDHLEKEIYWNPKDFVSDEEFKSFEFFELFQNAVSIRQEADVPVANFLSGGLDSTAIVKSLFDKGYQANTYSLGFSNPKYDETKWSNKVSELYSTNHWQETLAEDISTNDIINSIKLFDEPYSDPSTLPSYIISKAISKKYKVAISGDGGDELLGGYTRIKMVMDSKFNTLSHLNKIYPPYLGTGNFFLKKNSKLKQAYASFFEDMKFMNLLNIPIDNIYQDSYFHELDNDYKSLLLSDYLFYLPQMMMLKIDRTSMANSLETRSPFVDHRLVEYVMSRDTKYYSNKIKKPIINDYLKNDFNSEFLSRRKMGFVFQIEDWVYNNIELIFNNIEQNSITSQWSSKLNKLMLHKSRINANRIWKIYFLSVYFE